MSNKNFYITTAIAYANGSPHLGHAYEQILTDVMARHKRLDGFDVKFLTGMDEHGQKVAKTSEKLGMTPIALCDKIAAEFRALDDTLDSSYDDFIRTTEPRHYEASKAIWNAIKQNNPDDIFLDNYGGWYSVRDEAFFGENELQEGPNGTKLAPTGAPVEWSEESSYFFRLSAYTDKLLKYYEDHPDFIQPETRRNEIISFVKGGLQDLSISRTTFSWGVPVPNDEKHVMYVWLDALTNYITGVGYPKTDGEFAKFWPADFHVIGKDIIRFHCIYWPAFLMSANLPIQKAVFAHGFINVNGEKMSKSVGNVIAPQDLINAYGVDQTRYIMTREVPHGQDGNFSHEHAVARINADLSNGLGNLAQRTLSQIAKNCEGKVPTHGEFTAEDKALLDEAYALADTLRKDFDKFQFHRGLENIWRTVYNANAYIDVQAPWTLKKTDFPRMETVLYVLVETIRCLALSIQAVVPKSSTKMLDQVSVPEEQRSYAHISSAYALKPGTALPAPEGVFPRIEPKEEKVA